MPKTSKVKKIDFEKMVMAKVKANEITMKPKWYFLLGSISLFLGLMASIIGAIFLINLTIFLLRQHGPNGQWRFQLMVDSFPWWIPLMAVVGIITGLWLLKKYDFSYKKNFLLISAFFIVAMMTSAFAIDQLGLNDIWSRKGPMRRFYQQLEGQTVNPRKGPGRLFDGKGQRFNFK